MLAYIICSYGIQILACLMCLVPEPISKRWGARLLLTVIVAPITAPIFLLVAFVSLLFYGCRGLPRAFSWCWRNAEIVRRKVEAPKPKKHTPRPLVTCDVCRENLKEGAYR